MDKIATNNFLVVLRKDVKAAKAMVAGNLVRKIASLKEELEKKKDDELQRKKIEAKIEKVHSEVKLLKTIDNYLICKDAIMKPDANYWNNLIGDSKASAEECLKARVISKTKVQKQVQDFRSQHVDCDEWLEEYFEFREKKKDLMDATQLGKKKLKMRRDRVRETREKKKTEKLMNRKGINRKGINTSSPRDEAPTNQNESNSLHPSWASKRHEKELLKKAFSGISKTMEEPQASNRVVFNKD